MTSTTTKWFQRVYAVGFLIVLFMNLRIISYPLTGTHRIRQADTLFTGYSYCIGDSTFLYPKVAHREATSGIAIGEFPLFSKLISLPCELTGSWSEWPPKAITYLLWFVNLAIWGTWFRRRNPAQDAINPMGHLLFFTFSPLLLTYLLIPMPDVLALAILGLAGISWQFPQTLLILLGSLLFSLAFGMRPYLFPMLFVMAPSLKIGVVSFGLSGIFYLLWFKFWIKHTEIWYYATTIKPLTSLIDSGFKALSALTQQILLSHLNYLGLIPFVVAMKKHRRLLFAWLFAIAFVLVLKGDHFVNHAYYFMSAGLIAAIAMTEGFLTFSPKQQKLFFVAFTIMGLIAVQHNWRLPHNERYKTLPQVMAANQVRFEDRIAVYDTFNPQTFYLAKKVGWYFEKTDWKGPASCPPLAQWALLFDEADHPLLIPCQADLKATPTKD